MVRTVRMDAAMVVAAWPEDAPRGAVTRFCRDAGVSRSWFYEVRARVAAEGVAGLGPRPRARSSLATAIEIEEIAVRIRKQLADDGLDYGPVTVRDRMLRLGIAAPSRATLARLFTRRGMVVPQPQKRPRSAVRRFVAARVHECWQLDAFEWPLLDGEPAVVFQLEDDHSRYLVASRAAAGETAADAIAVFDTAVADFQVPQRLLTDNGRALNPWRRGVVSRLVSHVKQLGVKPITGQPGHPQTQGKDERVHATLQQWLRVRPRAATLAELQAQVDTFDAYYNFQRGHQALGVDPATGWLRTPAQALAEDPGAVPPKPPEPELDPPTPQSPVPGPSQPRDRARPSARPRTCWQPRITTVTANGKVSVANKQIQLGAEHAGNSVHILIDGLTITIFDASGHLIRTVETTPSVHYYGNGKPTGGYHPRRAAGRDGTSQGQAPACP